MDHDDETIRHTIGELSLASHYGGVQTAASSDSALPVGPPCVGWNRGHAGGRGALAGGAVRSVCQGAASSTEASGPASTRPTRHCTVSRKRWPGVHRAARRQRLRPLAHAALVRTAARALHRGSAKNLRLLALVRGAARRRREALHRYRQGAAPCSLRCPTPRRPGDRERRVIANPEHSSFGANPRLLCPRRPGACSMRRILRVTCVPAPGTFRGWVSSTPRASAAGHGRDRTVHAASTRSPGSDATP